MASESFVVDGRRLTVEGVPGGWRLLGPDGSVIRDAISRLDIYRLRVRAAGFPDPYWSGGWGAEAGANSAEILIRDETRPGYPSLPADREAVSAILGVPVALTPPGYRGCIGAGMTWAKLGSKPVAPVSDVGEYEPHDWA